MANLTIRNLDDVVADLLRKRAADHGVSMEEEVRRILRVAVTTPTDLAQLATGLFGAEHGVDLDLPRHPSHEPPRFC
ncbi:MAG: FitA-like ribbon-helix-helix domain-containing protein [Acidimicrobiales bacterium]